MVNKKALAAGGVAAVAGKTAPVLLALGVGYLLFTGLKGDGESGGGSNSSFLERYVTNTIQEGASNTITYLKESVPGQYFTGEEPKNQNIEIYGPLSPYATAGGTADPDNTGTFDFLTKGPIGLLFGGIDYAGKSINPMPEDIKATQKKLGSGNFNIDDIANPNNPINKTLGFGTPKGINVAEIKTHQQAVSMGLGLAPLAVNAQTTGAEIKASKQAESLANKMNASGMSSSNLNKGTVTGTEKDKNGVERTIIKYNNGITMRY